MKKLYSEPLVIFEQLALSSSYCDTTSIDSTLENFTESETFVW